MGDGHSTVDSFPMPGELMGTPLYMAPEQALTEAQLRLHLQAWHFKRLGT